MPPSRLGEGRGSSQKELSEWFLHVHGAADTFVHVSFQFMKCLKEGFPLARIAGVAMQGRDVFNEKPAEEEIIDADAAATAVLPPAATLHTTLGDIVIKLYGELCPRTVENFATHAKNGYFDTILFHRVIKNFMIQTGTVPPLICVWCVVQDAQRRAPHYRRIEHRNSDGTLAHAR
jgi:hypothetical protein